MANHSFHIIISLHHEESTKNIEDRTASIIIIIHNKNETMGNVVIGHGHFSGPRTLDGTTDPLDAFSI
jgi:hypothetical protein